MPHDTPTHNLGPGGELPPLQSLDQDRPKLERLIKPNRLIALLCLVVLGLIPSFAFFVWIERNLALPWVQVKLGWPWPNIGDLGYGSLTLRIAWDAVLISAFGIIHSVLAQKGPKKWLSRILAPQLVRPFYVICTGIALIGVMACWQYTGRVLWALNFPQSLAYALSVSLFWGFTGLAVFILSAFDLPEFIGLKQLYSSRTELIKPRHDHRPLCTTGFYGHHRHPTYVLLLLAIFVTPIMTLDRFILGSTIFVYLLFAVPIEERKLIEEYGPQYLQYRKRVPGFFPNLLSKTPRL